MKKKNNMSRIEYFMNIEEVSKRVFFCWKQTFDEYEYIIDNVEKYIYNEYIKAIEVQNCTLQEKCSQLDNIYYEIIKEYVTHYTKKELLIGLIAIKEFISKM